MRASGPGTSALKEQLNKIISVAVVLMLLASAGLAQEEKRYAELPNFIR
jgi:hypothetical protein